jgi:hypothetical protein
MTAQSNHNHSDHQREESLGDYILRKGGKRITSYALPEVGPTKEAKRKAKQRAEERKDGDTQFYITMTKDKVARETVRAVAAAVKNPQVRSIISAVVAGDPFFRRIFDATTIVEDNLETSGGFGETNRDFRDGLRSVIDDLVRNKSALELIRRILAEPALAALSTEIAQRQDLKELVTAAVDRPQLVDRLWTLSKAEDNTLLFIDSIIRSPAFVDAVRNAGSNPLLRASVEGAVRHPLVVTKAVSTSNAGGIKARMLRWVLAL